MCGIIGFYTKQATTENLYLLHNLMRESKVRGLHAFGCVWYEKSTLQQNKWFNMPDKEWLNKFIGRKDFKLIFHNRYSTSGNWENMKNNQPIIVQDIAIAMNGVVTMKPPEEWRKEYDVFCETENDAEIFLRLIEYGEKPLDILKSITGSFAAVVLEDDVLYALRNSKRPLYWFYANKAIYIISTIDIAYRVNQGIAKNTTRVSSIPTHTQLNVGDLVQIHR